MWAVIVSKVSTPFGKQLIRSHDEDAQTVLKKLHDKATTSVQAEHNAEDLLAALTESNLKKWTGTYTSFLEKWDTSMFLWCELALPEDQPSDNQKKKYLRAALCTVTVMAQLETQENLQTSDNHPKWSYEKYTSLAMSIAVSDDRSNNRTSKTSRTSRTHQTRDRTGRGPRGGRGGGRGGRHGARRGGRGGRGGQREDTSHNPNHVP